MGDSVREGRSKHLAELAKIFQHRHGTWRDFGHFLNVLFGEGTPYELMGLTLPRRQTSCRHNSGGAHHGMLTMDRRLPPGAPELQNVMHPQECKAFGSFDPNKNPGLVVTDLCQRAVRFLAVLGRGDEDEQFGRDFQFIQPLPDSSPMSTPGLSAVTDNLSAIESSLMLDGELRPRREQTRREEGLSSIHGGSYDGDSLFEDSDVEEDLNDMMRAEEETLDGASITSHDDSVVRRAGPRQSTKMRGATLAYLWKFADSPVQLRDEFRRLRTDPSLYVLHLCGCGLCVTVAPGGVRSFGCCERSHLTLGNHVVNGHHRSYHEVLQLCPPTDYRTLRECIQRGVDGEGIF